MTFDDLTPDEQAALAWLIRVTLWYGHGHHDATPALVSLWAKGLAAVDAEGGTWSSTYLAEAVWAERRPARFWEAA